MYAALKDALAFAKMTGPEEPEDLETVSRIEQLTAKISEALRLLDGQTNPHSV